MASSAKASTSNNKSSAPKPAAKREVKSLPADNATPPERTTPTRNTSVPPKAKANGKVALAAGVVSPVTREMIAERAYHLWLSGAPGGEFEHWCCAERELNGGK